MMRNSLRFILLVCGVLLLFASIAPWVLGYIMITAAGPGEYVSVRDTGMVTCPEVLEWTSWTTGSGELFRGGFSERINPQVEIVAHRIGTDRKWFAELTMYQAKYRHPDGRVEIGAANGPKSIVSLNRGLASIVSTSAMIASIFSFLIASRLKVAITDES